jgi:alkyl hydroperoxide reductase subunit AhpF
MSDLNQHSEQLAVEEEHIDVLVVGGGPVGKSFDLKKCRQS